MVATTSGTTTFTLDVDQIIEEAMEPLGGDYTSGLDQAKVRRTLNLLLIEMQNKKIPLSKLDQLSVPLIAATSTYTLDTSVNSVLEVTLKTVSTGDEYSLSREGMREYHSLPNKTQAGIPTMFVTERDRDAVTLKVWPVIEASNTHTIELLVAKRIEDITAAYQKIDLPHRFYPLLVVWLSYKLSISKKGIPEEIKNRLKMELTEILMDTFEEDRERTDFFIVPGGISGR